MAKINEQNGEIIWQKRLITSVYTTRGLSSIISGLTHYNGSFYTLINHNLISTSNQYIIFAKLDLDCNFIWKRLFQ
jgi:hypothetical protein